jgi:hypothetical protein
MSSVTSTGHSPLTDMTNRIAQAVKAGALTQTDATALDKALTSIDSSLSSGASSSSSSASGDMKSKVDSLIADQVSSGALTKDQASELQAFFASGPDGKGGGQGAGQGGAPDGPPPTDSSATSTTSASSSSSDSSSSVTDSSTADDKMKALLAFLQNMREAASQSSGSYSLGQSSSSGTAGAIYTNYA